jgi:hypothetical protein
MFLFTLQLLSKISPQLTNTGVWLNGCLIAPLYGRLNPGQIYSPEVSDIPIAVAPASPRDTEKTVGIQKMMGM